MRKLTPDESNYMVKYSLSRIHALAMDDYGKPKLVKSLDVVMEDIYGVCDFGQKLSLAKSDKAVMAVMTDFGLSYIVNLCTTPRYYNAVVELIRIDADLHNLRRAMTQMAKRGKKRSKSMKEEYDALQKLYGKGCKALRDELNITKGKKGYKNRYQSVRALLNEDDDYGRAGGFFGSDDDDDEYGDDQDSFISNLINGYRKNRDRPRKPDPFHGPGGRGYRVATDLSHGNPFDTDDDDDEEEDDDDGYDEYNADDYTDYKRRKRPNNPHNRLDVLERKLDVLADGMQGLINFQKNPRMPLANMHAPRPMDPPAPANQLNQPFHPNMNGVPVETASVLSEFERKINVTNETILGVAELLRELLNQRRDDDEEDDSDEDDDDDDNDEGIDFTPRYATSNRNQGVIDTDVGSFEELAELMDMTDEEQEAHFAHKAHAPQQTRDYRPKTKESRGGPTSRRDKAGNLYITIKNPDTGKLMEYQVQEIDVEPFLRRYLVEGREPVRGIELRDNFLYPPPPYGLAYNMVTMHLEPDWDIHKNVYPDLVESEGVDETPQSTGIKSVRMVQPKGTSVADQLTDLNRTANGRTETTQVPLKE